MAGNTKEHYNNKWLWGICVAYSLNYLHIVLREKKAFGAKNLKSALLCTVRIISAINNLSGVTYLNKLITEHSKLFIYISESGDEGKS